MKSDTKSQSKKSQFSAWVRCMLLTVPSITIDGLRTAFAKSKLPDYMRPNPAHMVEGWQEIKERWGINGAEDVPRFRNELNVSALIRSYIDRFGKDKTEKEAMAYFAEDGIKLRVNSFNTVKSTYLKNGAAPAPDVASRDEREKLPPGSRSKVKRAKRIVKALEASQPVVIQDGHNRVAALSPAAGRAEYERIEEALEKLLTLADKLDNHSLFADLRNARRRASAAILG